MRSATREFSCVWLVAGTAVLIPGLLHAADPPSPEELIARMERQECSRAEALRDYESMRRYNVKSVRFGQEANMGVRVNYVYPGRKNMQVLWQDGSHMLQTRVFRKLLDAEVEAASDGIREQTRITTRNYTFKPVRREEVDGRPTYVYDLIPKRKCRFLMRGRVWVDEADAAVVRIEGEPLETTSFWVKRVHTVQEYRKVGDFWLTASSQTDADVRLFGPAHLSINYEDYQVNRSLLASRDGEHHDPPRQ